MTIYQQIQRAVDSIESNLGRQNRQSDVAKVAGMSPRSFQHYFWMITGYRYTEYLVLRRMDFAAQQLESSDMPVIGVAFDSGYRTHESFSRAFRKTFNVSPVEFRRMSRTIRLNRLKPLELYKEIAMGVIIKELPELLTISFRGFAPDPEDKAKAQVEQWMKNNPSPEQPRRIFGHNIDSQGNPENNPDNTGYKFYVTLTSREAVDGAGSSEFAGNFERIRRGTFAVTGIEGSLVEDQQGNFIRKGWERMIRMIKEKGYRLAENPRWFEEELEPGTPGNLRLDLYIEIDKD